MERISVRHIIKYYPLYNKKWDRMKEAFSLTRKKYHRDFYALRDISFTIDDGECVGVIGLNGSGKSTLLKIIAGVLSANEGNIQINGKVSALLELGAGFNPEYTGMENIFLSSMLAGYTEQETKAKIDDILQFADIGEFIHQPIRMYSSGMFVRLAFSVAINVNPDILIIDEALSVGDVFFQQKCYKKIKDISGKSTVVIVSHDMNALTKFCNRIIVLDQGKLVFDGDPNAAITEYFKIKQGSVFESSQLATQEQQGEYRAPDEESYSGQMEVKVLQYNYSINGVNFARYCERDDRFEFKIRVESSRTILNSIIGYQVRDKYGNEVFGQTNITNEDHVYVGQIVKGTSEISFGFVWPEIREGDYFITLGIGEGEHVLHQKEQCWLNNVIHVNNTTRGKTIYGIFNHNMECFSINDIRERLQ